MLSERSQGWLRYLHRKASTPDSWERDGRPHDHWDGRSDPPMLSWRRFDLIESTYAVALMADQTPAWREVYARVLDELVFRHTGWWAAEDWLTQFGHDPERERYPDFYRLLVPPDRWGRYDVPGWTANGVWPWGLQMDPVGADGNLFFKGFFLVMLGLHLRTTGDARWNEPFDMIRDGEHTFTWHHSRIAAYLADQWRARPWGCHCENTKIWPLCLSGAGLGLQLHDLLRGTNHHEVFDRWFTDTAVPRYFRFDEHGRPPATVTLYYDPTIDYHHLVPVMYATFPAYYLAPQRPVEARALFDAACAQMGLLDLGAPISPPDPRRTAGALHLAKEWALGDLADALQTAADQHYEPSWDRDRGEFTWRFGLDEPHPRGQYNGTMAAAEAMSENAWSRLANTGPGERFDEPTVEGVDFPTLTVTQAFWDAASNELHVSTAPMNEEVVGQPTSFRITQLPERAWVIDTLAGPSASAEQDRSVLTITARVAVARYRVRPR